MNKGMRIAICAFVAAFGLSWAMIRTGSSEIEMASPRSATSGNQEVADWAMDSAIPSVQDPPTVRAKEVVLEADWERLREVDRSLGDWNAVTSEFVGGYLDQDLDALTWVLNAESQLWRMSVCVSEIRDSAEAISDPEMRALARDIADVYAAKLSASDMLKEAVSDGSEARERFALGLMTDAVTTSRELVSRLPLVLERVASPQEIASIRATLRSGDGSLTPRG